MCVRLYFGAQNTNNISISIIIEPLYNESNQHITKTETQTESETDTETETNQKTEPKNL